MRILEPRSCTELVHALVLLHVPNDGNDDDNCDECDDVLLQLLMPKLVILLLPLCTGGQIAKTRPCSFKLT